MSYEKYKGNKKYKDLLRYPRTRKKTYFIINYYLNPIKQVFGTISGKF